MKQRIGGAADATNKFNNAIQQSTISLTSLRSGVGDPPKVNVIPSVGGGDARLPCCCPAPRRSSGSRSSSAASPIRRSRSRSINAGEDPVVTPQDYAAAIARSKSAIDATPSRRDRDADDGALRHRRATASVRAGVKSYGIFPGIIPAASILSMHGDAEFMPVDALGPAIQILFEALKDTCVGLADRRDMRTGAHCRPVAGNRQPVTTVRRSSPQPDRTSAC